MFVSEWMTATPQTVSSKTPVMEAMQLLRKGGYRRLPVVDGDKLVGIVTDRDLKEATPSKATTLSVYELNYLLSKLTVHDVMVTPVITVAPEEPVENAALLMEEHKISGLPVVSGGTLQGIFTITDMLRAIVAMLGLKEGGTRVTVSLPDEPGVLARAASAAAPSNIIAVVTAGVQAGHKRELVLRVTGEGAESFPERLRAGGLEVTDVR
ncbi:CBS domain-containing protein [Truepera radiovictrix]|uniref:CBS domain containing protein n=1 Tax=Truepera radiovictrix (strain DSM 17093 / CIP 108686 / LMG 22925 / RQ-24) TaxID=649638 RepID=D7CRP8_TRURR|nr:CBS domain-containing protein [Truepera radiovictrix]ADI13538.1 CBS domain containing protein [Truepera radiovictrix DSM 17093]WMT57899.1 CBS domain-containing protein [Truepera radiovictrix]